MKKQQLKATGDQPVIELVDLVKQFEDKVVLQELNMSINKGEFITLLGPSGSGKTTALRLIAGFEWPTRGEIRIHGADVKDLPAHKRPTNTIFQDYALFPHLTVEGNIKYGLKLFRVKKEEVSANDYKKLDVLKEKWLKETLARKRKLDKEQDGYLKIIADSKAAKHQKTKAQKWFDNSDFLYSYWDTYVFQKTEQWKNTHTRRKLTKEETKKAVRDMIELIGLEGNEKKAINELSGGMKQRVALARSLVLKPEVLLLDEPLSALDLKVRQKMQRELKTIQRKLGLTFIFVTHDQEEAMTISDRVAVMRDGKIEQFGTPREVYDNPINKWVAEFIGESNIFKATVTKKDQISLFNKVLKANTNGVSEGKIDVVIRPEDIEPSKGKKKGIFDGIVTHSTYQGVMWEYNIKSDVAKFLVHSTKELIVGEKVSLSFAASDIHVMLEES